MNFLIETEAHEFGVVINSVYTIKAKDLSTAIRACEEVSGGKCTSARALSFNEIPNLVTFKTEKE